LFAQVQQQPNPFTAGGPVGIVGNVGALGALICYIIVLVKMFQNGQTGLAVGCLLGSCLCGIGGLVAYIYGWMKSGEWRLMPVMLIWTLMIIIWFGAGGYVYSTHPELYQMPTTTTNP